MRFYISSQCSPRRRIGAALQELASLGFLNVELTGGTEWYPQIHQELDEIRQRLGLKLFVHNYFPPQRQEFVLNLAVIDQARRTQMMNLAREALALTKHFGNRVYGIHPGFRQDVAVELENGFFKPGDPMATSEDAFYRMLDDLNTLACEEDVHIAIENLAPRSKDDRFSFLTDSPDIDRFLAYIQDKVHLGMLVDFGHLGAAAALFGFEVTTVLDKIFERPEKILEIHLSENAGGRDVHGVTPLDSWQIRYLKAQQSRLSDIPVVFEWQNAATIDNMARFEQLIQQLGNPSQEAT